MSEVRLVDANALKAKIKSKYDNDDAEFDRGYNIGLEAAVDLIDSAPTVTPDMAQVLAYECGKASAERPIGKWIDTGDMEEYWAEEYQCSICGAKDHWHNYCPNCGAKMEEAEDE